MNTRMDVRFNGGKLNDIDGLKEMCNDVMGSAFVGDKFEMAGEHEKLKQSEVKSLMDSLMLSKRRKETVWKEITEVLMAPSETLNADVEQPAPTDMYKGLVPLTRNMHLFEYEGSFHSYLLAATMTPHLHAVNKKDLMLRPGTGISPRVMKLFTKSSVFDYRLN